MEKSFLKNLFDEPEELWLFIIFPLLEVIQDSLLLPSTRSINVHTMKFHAYNQIYKNVVSYFNK